MRNIGIVELHTRITFYEFAPNDGPDPGESEKKVLYECWGKIEEVWLKDLEQAKQNGTLSDLTITIRDPQDTYIPSNKHYLSINARQYKDNRYNIKHVQPDLQNRRFITIVAGLSS